MDEHRISPTFWGGVALVTGAGRGAGRAIALALGRAGARVAVNDLNPENAEATAAEIVANGGEAAAWVADVSRKHPIQNMIDEVQERWGQIDVLVNAARVEPSASVLKMDERDWERTIGVNLKGAFLMCQSVGRVMKEAGGGAIVNIAWDPENGRDGAAFAASQAGLLSLTRACAREYAPFGIRVNAVCLDGRRKAGSTPVNKPEAVELVLQLCSAASAESTGQVYPAAYHRERAPS